VSIVLVVVGSKRMPKLSAVSAALEAVGPLLAAAFEGGARFEVVGVDAPSGVGHTPLGRAEVMAGARGRAEALLGLARERGEPWRYFVGLEGGLDVVQDAAPDGARRLVLLENWAYVCDAAGRGAYGHSGGIVLPELVAAEVLDRGTELSTAIDRYAGGRGIRDAQGAWGVLTQNLITRQEAFRVAVISAFAPFFNRSLYLSSELARTGAGPTRSPRQTGAGSTWSPRQKWQRDPGGKVK
jgi:inosine/xanthosine triphosphatase